MRHSPLAATITLDLGPSLPFAIALGLFHLAGVAALLLAGLAWWWVASGSALLLAMGGWAILRHALLRGQGAIRRVVVDAEDEWWLTLGDGRSRPACLLPDSYVHPQLLVLRFATGWRRRVAIVLPGMAHAEVRRRLTARLRLRGVRAGRASRGY